MHNTLLEEEPGAIDASHEHAHPIREQGAADGVMDVGLDHDAIEAQLMVAGEVVLLGQRDDVVEQPVEGGRLDEVSLVLQL